jgi:hypothetical protein
MLRHPLGAREVLRLALVKFAVCAIATISSVVVCSTARAQNLTFSYTLRWTAPGDDSACGTAKAYDLRYSLSPITEANWNQALTFSGIQLPRSGGTSESFSLYGLDARYSYYVALKSVDEKGNWSKMSNVIVIHAPIDVASASDSTSLELSAPWPNPARNAARFAFALPHGGAVEMEAMDIAGRHIRTLAEGNRSAGRSEIAWDLSDDHGRRVPPGVYLVRGRLLDRVSTRVVTVVR